MKFYVDEKFVYFVQETQNPSEEKKYLLHKAPLDCYGFFNTVNGIPIYDLFAESNNMNDFNNLKRLEDLLMPKDKLAQGGIQLSLFWVMLGSWLRDHTTCFFHHEHLHWERLRQSQGVPERTSGGVRCGYGQHPDHGSSCVRGLRWSCVCTGRRDGRLLNWHTGHSGISKGALQFICSPHTPQHHGNPFTHRNRNAWPHCG